MMDPISSLLNLKVKHIRQLRQRKNRQEEGIFIVEGIRHVGEAADASRTGRARIDSLYYAPDLLTSGYARELIDDQSKADVPCYAVSAEVFTSIADKENPQGILALVSLSQPALTQLSPTVYPWLVALVSPQDPGNVGAILRSLDAVGASGLLLLDASVDPYHPSVVRSSMGSLFWYPVVRAGFSEFIAWARNNSYQVVGASAHAEYDYSQAPYQMPLILLLGSERHGLSPDQQAACDLYVRMPMRGRTSSLNLAVAAGVLLYKIAELT